LIKILGSDVELSNQDIFINKVKDKAVTDMKSHGVLASLTIAQAILESGWGSSNLATTANNLFGIKRNGYDNYVTVTTTEEIDGEIVEVVAEFRKYNSWDESIADHTLYLTTRELSEGVLRYGNLLWKTDYKEVCKLILEDGYSTYSTYTQLLVDLIERYKLYEYDNIEEELPMFNEEYYLATYPDVAAAVSRGVFSSGQEHYNSYGKSEGRRAMPELPLDYCEGAYLNNNSDIAAAVKAGIFRCGADHWLIHGWKENRKYAA
jgi:hypothetical protein